MKDILRKLIRAEIKKAVKEAYGMELPYYSAPAGFEQANKIPEKRMQRFTDHEKWQVIAMQLGAVIKDRGEDWIAVLPNNKVLGTFGKMTRIGTLEYNV